SSTMKSILGDAFMEELNSKGIVGDYAENARDALLNIIVNGEYDAKTLQVIAGSKAAQQSWPSTRWAAMQKKRRKRWT
ncbi:MAG: hypothetical protein IJ926_00310, partial [Firmicutes bacterium]|nr:hypothetical protein [Bacillota bacterium]